MQGSQRSSFFQFFRQLFFLKLGIYHIQHINNLFGGAVDKSYELNCRFCAGIDRSIIPSQSASEFIRGVVMLSDLLSWAIGIVGPLNFSAKWFVGRARPEEVVRYIFCALDYLLLPSQTHHNVFFCVVDCLLMVVFVFVGVGNIQ